MRMPFRSRSDYGNQGRWCGFTLIEMLVVVAIIALLITVLIPSLKKARDNAKLTFCKQNLHDLGIAMVSYSHIYPPWFPPAPYMGSIVWQGYDYPPADDNLFVLWYSKLAPDPAVFTCPATKHKIRTPSSIDKVQTELGLNFVIHTAGSAGHVNDFERLGQYSGTKGFGTSYEYNGWYSGDTLRARIWDFWHVKKYKHEFIDGNALYTTNVVSPGPWKQGLLQDADDSDLMAQQTGFGGITGSNGQAVNNWPEPWDNHGIIARNNVYADAHAETKKHWKSP